MYNISYNDARKKKTGINDFDDGHGPYQENGNRCGTGEMFDQLFRDEIQISQRT